MPPRKSDGTPKEKRQLVRWDGKFLQLCESFLAFEFIRLLA